MTNLFFGSFFLPKPKKCDKWHGTARHGTARHNGGHFARFFNMKKLLLKIGRKIDLFYFNLLSIHGDLRGKYPLYRVLERLSRLILSLPFRTVPGLKIIRVWALCLNWVYIWTPKEPLWFGILSFMITTFLADRLADRTVSLLCHFRWFRRIIGE
jgi:hypothetical protein